MRHGDWLGFGIWGLLVRDILGLLVLLRSLHVVRGKIKNWMVDHNKRALPKFLP
jgi:hypothetical protein